VSISVPSRSKISAGMFASLWRSSAGCSAIDSLGSGDGHVRLR
jgi:hypothetical protein